MEWTPYLYFDGNCAEAFRFYARILGGRIATMQTYGESPMASEVTAEMRDHIAHARLERGAHGQAIMGADSPVAFEKPQGFYIALHSTRIEAERIFMTLADGGIVQMPMRETYFAQRFGTVVDRFGTPWMITGDDRES